MSGKNSQKCRVLLFYIKVYVNRWQMKFETIVPPHGALASLGIAVEDFIVPNALVVAHWNTSAVDETDTRTLSEAEQLKKQHHLHRQATFDLHKAVIRELMWKQICQIFLHIE